MTGTIRRIFGVLAVWPLVLSAGCAATSPAGEQPANLSNEQSVKPGINERWKSEDIEPLIETLQAESREVYANRELLAAVVGPRPGSVVADVGSGSGFMARLFSQLVGPEGKVYAVDINSVMMDHVARRAEQEGITNLETVVCTDKSVELPPGSVDMMFICDTYHHFEYPMNTMRSIYEALRPGGQIVLVDFHRIPGVSREFILGHVRAGQDVFTREIVKSGFELINVHDLPPLEENYVLRFRRVRDAEKTREE